MDKKLFNGWAKPILLTALGSVLAAYMLNFLNKKNGAAA